VPIAVDKPIPDFTAAATGGEIALSGLRGKKVVLYFYPKDNTPGCTTEGLKFRDLYPKFRKAGAEILGVSRDSLRSHDNFKA
jgi:peroxiredoxin Q/BCP